MRIERPPDSPWTHELEPAAARERLRWARERGHPRYVWPDVAPSRWRAGLRAVETVVAAALRGESPVLDARQAGGGEAGARALGVAGVTSGVGALIGLWLEEGRVRASEPVEALFRLHLWHGRARADRQAAELARASSALATAGVAPLVVKTAHVARVYYPEAGARPAVDVDMVVPRVSFERAEAALRGAGYTMAGRQRRPAKSDWLPAGVEPYPRSFEVLHSGSHYGVDLQSSLDRNFFGVRTVRLARVEDAATRPAPELAPGVRVPDQPLLLAYQALHAAEGFENLTLIRLVDLVLIARRDAASGALDWGAFEALLAARGAARFAYPALALAERLAPGTLPAGLPGRLEAAAPPSMRRIVAGVTPATAQRLDVLSLRERFMWCATPWDYVRRLTHMAVPAPAGRSPRRLAAHYVDRVYRLLRGRVRVGGLSTWNGRV